MKLYESYLAACPHYCSEERMRVICAGWADGMTISVRFETVGSAADHKEQHCRSLKGCTDCPIHQMLDFELGNRKSPG
jgi:hypothetical protein